MAIKKIVVIADDITGAAEIAGIAFERGQQVRLLCASPVCGENIATEGTTVIATDTRSMTESEAISETHRMASQLPSFIHSSSLLFKKTDSALRGHVVAELSEIMKVTGYWRAVYMPANPSKGRIIRNGVYYIQEREGEGQEVKEVPISETDFSYDPEFPARTSLLKERFPDAEANNIIMPDAVSAEDIRQVIAQYDDGKTIFAGAADLFSAFLESPKDSDETSVSQLSSTHNTLILCGSTQSKSLDIGIPIAAMPLAVYNGEQSATDWFRLLMSQFSSLTSLILTIPHTHRTGHEVAVHLRTVMAEMTVLLVRLHCPDHLIIEGGATAWATLQALGWTEFQIERQIAPGVVQMRARCNTLVTLKPGSYSWGGLMG